MTTTYEVAPPLQATTPAGGRLATTDDFACNKPHTQWIFSGIGFRTGSPEISWIRASFQNCENAVRNRHKSFERWSTNESDIIVSIPPSSVLQVIKARSLKI
ncbi:hypothetical protein AVEN_217522-1 [Araneus ventricosus]|uniref:Uncharacterized protein n=1 Tax=Araneus ventricosus TaxID=182803 RepID=A0A4Y2RFL7_ARAVE|nr:hypothetical protein AVEN_196036-1 [Araneus ventricosus]GBN74582.1 hypothetical protein AVEN_87356-1 [Araneus ventricosus]GBN74588.1 hypothetical protein AVEN_121348-1 [Araneus ventricosus]GBN74611.1 hypothetical protein AVEN_217522-1 [Araneus ventricosus]